MPATAQSIIAAASGLERTEPSSRVRPSQLFQSESTALKEQVKSARAFCKEPDAVRHVAPVPPPRLSRTARVVQRPRLPRHLAFPRPSAQSLPIAQPQDARSEPLRPPP